MLSRTAWQTLLRLLDDPLDDGFPPDQLRQLPGGTELLASPCLTRRDAPFLTVARGPFEESVEYFTDDDGRSLRYLCPETGRTLRADPRHIERYAAAVPAIAGLLQQHLGVTVAPRPWGDGLLWLGEIHCNERSSTVLFAPQCHLERERLVSTISTQVVRTPAITLTAGPRKEPFCWNGGWGVALPIDQCLMDGPEAHAVLDLDQIALEVRRPHHDIARRLVAFDWTSHILRIVGVGEFPIAHGEAAAVVQRLVEAVWSGDAMVPLTQLRKAAGADTSKSLKHMLGRTAQQDRFIVRPQYGHYALRLNPD